MSINTPNFISSGAEIKKLKTSQNCDYFMGLAEPGQVSNPIDSGTLNFKLFPSIRMQAAVCVCHKFL